MIKWLIILLLLPFEISWGTTIIAKGEEMKKFKVEFRLDASICVMLKGDSSDSIQDSDEYIDLQEKIESIVRTAIDKEFPGSDLIEDTFDIQELEFECSEEIKQLNL